MQRTNIFLTDEQQKRLRRRAEEEGMSKSKLIRRILDEALAITQTPVSTEETIRATSGIWADRDEADLQEVLSWRREQPLDRLTP
jgi:plasmid stability protein